MAGKGFDPGVSITRELIAANPDAAMEHIAALVAESQTKGDVIVGLRNEIDAGKGDRDALDDATTKKAEAERRAAEAASENQSLRTQLADSDAQKSSLITGQEDALKAYRDLVIASNPTLPPSLISGGTLSEINSSVDAARGVVQHVQTQIAASNAGSRMPAGAPLRPTTADPATMTRSEKILYGVREARGEEMTG